MILNIKVPVEYHSFSALWNSIFCNRTNGELSIMRFDGKWGLINYNLTLGTLNISRGGFFSKLKELVSSLLHVDLMILIAVVFGTACWIYKCICCARSWTSLESKFLKYVYLKFSIFLFNSLLGIMTTRSTSRQKQ